MSHISDTAMFPLTWISQGFHSGNPVFEHFKALKKLCQGTSVVIWETEADLSRDVADKQKHTVQIWSRDGFCQKRVKPATSTEDKQC